MIANALFTGAASLVLVVGIYLPLYIVFTAISDWRLRRLHKHYAAISEPTNQQGKP
jgi:hypothetical protein